MTLEERFWANVDRRGPNDCWLWRGKGINGGYGRIRDNGRLWYAHRLSFWLRWDTEPEAVCHRCDNPPCVNPAHLREGTRADNTDEMWAKGRAGLPHANGKLSAEQIAEIRTRYTGGLAHTKALGAEFGISLRSVYRLINGPTPKCYQAMT